MLMPFFTLLMFTLGFLFGILYKVKNRNFYNKELDVPFVSNGVVTPLDVLTITENEIEIIKSKIIKINSILKEKINEINKDTLFVFDTKNISVKSILEIKKIYSQANWIVSVDTEHMEMVKAACKSDSIKDLITLKFKLPDNIEPLKIRIDLSDIKQKELLKEFEIETLEEKFEKLEKKQKQSNY
jgi:hypothetical protein